MDLGFFFSLLSKYLGMEGLDIMVGVMCNFLNEICQMTFQNDCSIWYSHEQFMNFQFIHVLINFGFNQPFLF